MDRFISGVQQISRICGTVAALCLVSGCLVVCQMVVMRYVLGASTVWQNEFVTYAIVAATLIGSPYVLLTRGHVNVDLLPHYLGPTAKRWLAVVAATFGLVFCGVLAWTGWIYFHDAWRGGWVTASVWAPPLWILLLPLPLGLGLLTLQYTADVLCLLTGREVGVDETVLPEELE